MSVARGLLKVAISLRDLARKCSERTKIIRKISPIKLANPKSPISKVFLRVLVASFSIASAVRGAKLARELDQYRSTLARLEFNVLRRSDFKRWRVR
ncbi:hypothetical protein D3C87_1845110 [compost metagenome]